MRPQRSVQWLPPVYLDQPVATREGQTPLHETIASLAFDFSTVDRKIDIYEAIKMASPKDQRRWRKYWEEGMSYQDISAAEGVSGAAVKQAVWRVNELIRKQLTTTT